MLYVGGDPECIQHTLQYVSKMNYLIIARTLAEKGYELNIGKMREEFFVAALQIKLSTVRDTYRDYLQGKLSLEDMKQILKNPKYRSMYWGMPVLEVALLWDIDDVAKRKLYLHYSLEMMIVLIYTNFFTNVLSEE